MNTPRIHCQELKVPVSRQTAQRLRAMAIEAEAELSELAATILEQAAIQYLEIRGKSDAETC